MIKNYLKITIRSLLKNKLFVSINVLGMGIALACCVVAYLNYEFTASFDHDQLNADKVYRINFVREFQGRTTKYGMSPIPLGETIRQNITEIDEVIRYYPNGGNVRIGDEVFNTNLTYVDPAFFEVFTFPMASGVTSGINDKSNIYISQKLATKYFGDDDPVGKPVTQILDSTRKEYVVAGVFKDMPDNSSFFFVEAITNYDNLFDNTQLEEDNWAQWSTVFIYQNDANRLSSITNQLQDFVEPQNNSREDFKITRYYLDPVAGMANRSESEDLRGHWFRSSLPVPAVFAPGIMAGLILLIACFNFTNTSIAISSRRLKEIGLRKVMGGRRKQLIAQFLGENVMLCLLALAVGLLVSEFLVPAYSQMWDFINLNLSYTEDINFILFLLALILGTGLIAGSYPAFYISKFEPTAILKGTTKFGGTNKFTRVLLTLQYAISILAIISAVAFVQNAKYQQDFDLGFDKEEVIYARLSNNLEVQSYKNLVAQNPDITDIATSEFQLFSAMRNDPLKYEEIEIESDILHVDEHYMNVMGIDVLEGRTFRADSETDRKESVLVSKEFIKQMGWQEAIGKRILWMDTVQLFVVGVIDDVYTSALWNPVEPLMIRYGEEEANQFVIVKADARNIISVYADMEAKWKEMFPNRLYNADYLNEQIADASQVNANILKLFLFLGIVATVLSASGLFTLVSLNIIKRMKEIGVRKVLGASIANIAKNLNRQFLIILLIAGVLGSLAANFMIDSLMDSIWAYHIDMNLVAFVLSVLVMFIISGVTIGFKIYSAASTNPVNTLRDE